MRFHPAAAVVLSLALFMGVLGLVSCSTLSGDSSDSGMGRLAHSSANSVAGYRITIPRLGVSSTLQAVGLNPDHGLEVPALQTPMQAGVYAKGPMPGQNGPTVVVAHINAHGQPGFGAGFHTLTVGDEIDTTTPQGPVRYRVTRTETVPKAQFPSAAVYSDTPGPELRLITCGGALDTAAHNYLDQTIVWANKI